MGSHKKKGSTFNPIVPKPIADYNVTGDIFPDAKCNYFEAGTFGGKPYYRRTDGAYYLWWEGLFNIEWDITAFPPAEKPSENCWYRADPNIVGIYSPAGTYTGNPTVAAGSH